MSIEVILKEHVEHLGRRGEIVKVASGYARNFLLPRKLALAVTEANKQQIEREKVRAEAKDQEEVKDAKAQAAQLEAATISIARRVGENETLYGSVTSADIADALAAQKLTVDRRTHPAPRAAQDHRRARGAAQAAPRRHRESQGARRPGRSVTFADHSDTGARLRLRARFSLSCGAASLNAVKAGGSSPPGSLAYLARPRVMLPRPRCSQSPSGEPPPGLTRPAIRSTPYAWRRASVQN